MTVSTLSSPDVSQAPVPQGHPNWSSLEKFLFRVSFLFFALLLVPLELAWYAKLFSVKTVFAFLNSLTGYKSNFYTIHSESGRWGLYSFASWGVALLIALAGAGIWTFIARNSKRRSYNELYYWLRVAVRYRIAIGIIAFGFLKLYPMQMPDPSISNLDTRLGDYNSYKIYWQIVGVSIWYEIVLGAVEIAAGVLLLFRSTAALGAVLVAGVLYNIAHANLAYDGGVHVYSAFFVLLSLFILVPYLPDLWKLLILQQNVTPNYYHPKLTTKGKRNAYYAVKYSIVFVFTILFGLLRYDVHYHAGQLKEPVTPGLPNARGYYNVTEFKLNNKMIPYSPLDSVRWQSVVFEKWSTLIYKVHKPFPISLANGTPNPKDIDRSYELAGIAGGRRFLYYTVDAKAGKLILQDKNRPALPEGESPSRKDRAGKRNKKPELKEPRKLVWNFTRPSGSRIIISGLNEQKDSIYAVLDRVEKHYPIKYDRADHRFILKN
jgi:hypothetical protein